MIYDVDYFISKFEAIPEEKWIVGNYTDGYGCCALGHCGIVASETTKEADSLVTLFILLNTAIPPINDNHDARYCQHTAKQRILAALYDIKKMLSKGQEVQECDAKKMSKETEAGTKIIHHYHKVTVPKSIETKELILS